jgi:thioredoxin reductase/Pyruvate/2-oxoacid:ferredoxin oxidoreductase delta subunit
MSWTLLFGLVLGLGLAACAAWLRRAELVRMKRSVEARGDAVRQGNAAGQLQHPIVDLSRCLGCATCVAVCPEEAVLDIVHGQATVVNGVRCIGIAACERECPVGAITVTLSNLEHRDDVPAINEGQVIGSPGLFLAGEVTAHALIKTAITQGTAVAAEAAKRPSTNGVLDLCIVGAGPAGLACSLEAKRRGLRFVTLDQEHSIGGTVTKYPRRKLVMTESVDLPLHGRLNSRTYSKEELVELWQDLARKHELPIKGGELFTALDRDEQGNYVVRTESGAYTAKNVCLALGRRGTPRKLDVPGEDRPKVLYSLIDANSYSGRRVLVVGGGDSAVEAAIGLSEQDGTTVTLAYRKEQFFRIRARNEERLWECVDRGRLDVLFTTDVKEIHEHHVELASNGTVLSLPNDELFVMAGGVPPLALLQSSGVSFDAEHRPPPRVVAEQGTGLARALAIGFCLTLVALLWALANADYYRLPGVERPLHPRHDVLRPGKRVGLGLGIAAAALIVVNLLYLIRRSPKNRFRLGSLRTWMTSHVATGILALLCAMLHGAMAPGDTVGGHAFWALAALMVTGGIGRYFYAYVPRAANGRELKLSEVKQQLASVTSDWGDGWSESVRAEVDALVEARQWKGSFFGRVLALLGVQRDLRRTLNRLAEQGRAADVPPERIRETLCLARKAHRTALMTAHCEDLRALLSSWRFAHRWVALLMVLLVLVHVISALAYRAL